MESELSPKVLYNKINELTNDKKTLEEMGNNARALAKPDALEEIYKTVLKAINNRK